MLIFLYKSSKSLKFKDLWQGIKDLVLLDYSIFVLKISFMMETFMETS